MPAILSYSQSSFDPQEFIKTMGEIHAIDVSLSKLDTDPISVDDNLMLIYACYTLNFLAKEGYAPTIIEREGLSRIVSAIIKFSNHEGPVWALCKLLTNLVGFGVTLGHIQQILSVYKSHLDSRSINCAVRELYNKLVDYGILHENQILYENFDGSILLT